MSSKETAKVFSKHTRDNADLLVMRDEVSGIIYIDDYFVGEDHYTSGSYRTEKLSPHASSNYERNDNAERRMKEYKQFYAGLNICDVGCGLGDFLYGAREFADQVYGVELQKNYLDNLNSAGVPCSTDIRDYKGKFDTIFSFHALEHFEYPIEMLSLMKDKLSKDGQIIVEVPHANDFLISTLHYQPFIEFTLWSQHLILHTRESLKRFLQAAGFKSIIIEGVQRYSLANHLGWLTKQKPGGHKGNLSMLDSSELHHAYQSSLQKIDATDTLVAVAMR